MSAVLLFLKAFWKPIAGAALLLALWLAWHTWLGRHDTFVGGQAAAAEAGRWKVANDAQKAQADRQLLAANKRADAAEGLLNAARATIDEQDFRYGTANASAGTALATLAGRASGRLRDPNATPAVARCGSGSGGQGVPGDAGAGHRDGDGAETGGLLSKELSGLLRARLDEADDINRAYAACRPDARALRNATAAAATPASP
ncbi:MAG: hypothetical protein V4505_25550 [Pseudomonadota bacterium]